MKGQTIAIVMGYGVPPDIFTDGNYQRYLTAVAEQIAARQINTIVLCGGNTNIYYPEKFEANEMQKLLCRTLDGIPCIREFMCVPVNTTITSWENLEAAAKAAERMEANRAVIFCEKTRQSKVWLIAKACLPYEFEVIGVDFDATRNWSKDVKQFAAIFLTALEWLFPPLRQISYRRQLRHIIRSSKK